MNRDEIINFLINGVVQIYHADAANLTEDTNLPEQFGTKSLQRVALCSLIENDIDVMISIGDIGKYPTIGNLADKIIEEME